MSHKLKSNDSDTAPKHDDVPMLGAFVGAMIGFTMSYAGIVGTGGGFHQVIVRWGLSFCVGDLANLAVTATIGLVVGIPGYYLGRLIDRRLAPKIEKVVLDAADKAAGHQPQHRGKK